MSAPTTSSLERTADGLSEDEFIVKCLSDMMQGWIPLKTYLRMYPDENKATIETRVYRGTWKRRVHYFAPKGGTAWVNLPAIHAWVSGADEVDEEDKIPEDVQGLMKFYDVADVHELVRAQLRHVEMLQEKLTPLPSMAPEKVRAG